MYIIELTHRSVRDSLLSRKFNHEVIIAYRNLDDRNGFVIK